MPHHRLTAPDPYDHHYNTLDNIRRYLKSALGCLSCSFTRPPGCVVDTLSESGVHDVADVTPPHLDLRLASFSLPLLVLASRPEPHVGGMSLTQKPVMTRASSRWT